MFGKKKKQEVVEDVADNEEDLAVAYGMGDQLNDDTLSEADSVPPPPPDEAVIDTKIENLSQEDTMEDSPSVGPADDIDELEKDKYAEQIKRKKLALIVSCIVSFIILLGLAIALGVRGRTRSNNASLVDEELEFESSTTSGTATPTTLEIEPVVALETEAPSTGTTVFDPFAGCVANEISVLTTCAEGGGGASVNMTFCLVDELTDQFWAWVNTPPRTAPIIANDWGWMRDGGEAELPFLGEGRYEVGLFSDGEMNFVNYPLINSTQFIINCRQ